MYERFLALLLLIFLSVYTNGQTVHHFDIFGSAYAAIEEVDQALKNQVFYLVSGHGGPDPGAVGKHNKCNVCEDEYAYDVVLRLGRDLISHAAKVYIIIRSDDGIRDESKLKCLNNETCWKNLVIPRSQKKRLKQRSDCINTLSEQNKYAKLQTAIVLHIDSRAANEKVDMFFYHQNNCPEGSKLAHTMQGKIKEKYALYQKGRGYYGSVETRDLHMLRETNPTTLYIELGNLNNWRDLKRVIQVNNRQAVADWLCEGIVAHQDHKSGKKQNATPENKLQSSPTTTVVNTELSESIEESKRLENIRHKLN